MNNDHLCLTFEQRPFFWVPRAAVVHRFDCNYFFVENSSCLRFHEEFQSDEKKEIRNIPNFFDCQSWCKENPECNFWSWTLPSHVNINKCFHFDSSKVSLIQNSSAISGRKDCKGKSNECWIIFKTGDQRAHFHCKMMIIICGKV